MLNRSGCANAASQFADATYETPLTPVWGVPSRVATYTGAQLLGLGLSAPNAKYPVVYTLPLLTISMTKGTGVFRASAMGWDRGSSELSPTRLSVDKHEGSLVGGKGT